MDDVDDFDDAFLDSDGESGGTNDEDGDNDAEGAGGDGAGGANGKADGNDGGSEDDVVSIGSSSSSSDDDDDGSSSSSASSSSSGGDDDDENGVESRPAAERERVGGGIAGDDDAVSKGEGERGDSKRAVGGGANDERRNADDDDEEEEEEDDDLLDSVLDDDDLAEFFSQKPSKEKQAPRQQQEQQRRQEGNATPRSDDYGLDSLDDAALAELEENDFDLEDGTASPSDAGTKEEDASAAGRDFTVSYNGEKRRRRAEEDFKSESESEEEEEEFGDGAMDKENRSPNERAKPQSGHSTKRRQGGDNQKSDEILELFGGDLDDEALSPRKSPTRGGGSSSLDTPRENPKAPSLTPTRPAASKRKPPVNPYQSSSGSSGSGGDEDGTAASKKKTAPNSVSKTTTNPYRTDRRRTNPYQKQHRRQSQTEQGATSGGDLRRHDVENRSASGSSTNQSAAAFAANAPGANNSAVRGASSTATVAPGIAPGRNAQQTEVSRLGIAHSRYKPPPYAPNRPDPIVHRLDRRNRPHRRNIAVDQVFALPVRNIWKDKFAKFNHVQSEMANLLANSDDNVIVSAPTGAGKTALFEMAMARMFSSNLVYHNGAGGQHNGIGRISKARKAVYVAPSKALCEERQSDWSRRLSQIDPGMLVTTITGDVNSDSAYSRIADAHLILTTPEKWDSITRRWNDQLVLLASVKLLLVDEVHMIGEAGRGGCLESVIGRMKTIARAGRARALSGAEIASSSYRNTTPEAIASNMRIVAVSATLPNLDQLASFVESGEAYVFDHSYRPVPLNIYVQACGHINGKNRYMFDKSLAQHVPGILKQFSSGRPAIVFCHSKKETEQLADELSAKRAGNRNNDPSALINFANRTDTAALRRTLRGGVAFHHAGLDPSDRRLVEEAFGSGAISCLCATSTLAMGVNLPSHLVVIKGTSAYRGADVGHVDVDTGTLLQMMGRAGRPGFDESGTAVIMTDTASKTKYENVSQGLKVVESHLMENDKLAEVLNVEISQGVIVSAEEAADYVKGTFLYRRIRSNPLFYGLRRRRGDDEADLRSFVLDKCADAIDKLRGIRSIAVEEDGTFHPNAGCHVMSRNFVNFDTMKAIVKLPHDSGPVQLLHMMANCAKIQTQVRRSEKKHLNEAYKLVKYKMEGPQSKIRIQTEAEKAFVMLQSAIGRHHFPDHSLRQQMSNAIDGASQILSAVEQHAKEGSGHGQVAMQATLFRRSIFSSLWGENDGVLNQIGGVTQAMATRLKENGVSTFADAMNSSEEEIVKACGVPPSFANSLRAAASKILQRTLRLSACTKAKDDGGIELHVKLGRRVAGGTGGESGGEKVVSYSLFVFTDRPGGLLHYSEDITTSCELRVQCPGKFGRAYIRLVGNLIGLDEQVTVDGNDDHIERSNFTLSPTLGKSSAAKGKQQGKPNQPPPTSRKRLFDSHRRSVSNVSDLRLHKRGKARKGNVDDDDGDCIIVDDAAAAQKSCRKKLVTPSPHPRTKQQNSNDASSSASRSENTNLSQQRQNAASGRKSNNPYSSKSTGANRKGPRDGGRSSSWFQEKKQQRKVQETAFHSPKENPFASYSFDPNNIENSLDSNADRSKHPAESVIPNELSSKKKSYLSARRPRYGQAFRTPANGRRKSTAASGRISSVGLLQQKAAELQQHHASQATASRGGYANRGSAMQRHAVEAPSAHNVGFPPDDGRMLQQRYGESFHEPNQMMGPMMSQQSYCHRPGTSAVGAIRQQQSFGMSPNPPSLTPPFMGRRNNNGAIAQANNGYMMQGPTASAGRPMSPAGHGSNNFHQTNYGASMHPQHQFPTQGTYDFQPQNDFRSQHLFQPHTQEFEPFPEFDAGFQQGMPQQQFDNTFNDPLCHGLDPTYGNVDVGGVDELYHGPSFGNNMDVGVNANNMSHDPSFGDINAQQPRPPFGGGQQFEGGNRMVHNPYNPPPRQQQDFHSNPYNRQPHQQLQQQQQQQDFHSHSSLPANDRPPLTEVVVQNRSVPRGGQNDGDDASQFDDAFL